MKPETGNLKPEGVHTEFDDWAAAAITDGLSESENVVFAAHLATCPTCAALYQKTLLMNQTLTDAFSREGPSSGFENQVVRAFRQKEERAWWKKIPTTIAWLLSLRSVQTAGIMAALTLLVAVGSRLTNPALTGFASQKQLAAKERSDALDGKDAIVHSPVLQKSAERNKNEPPPLATNAFFGTGPQPEAEQEISDSTASALGKKSFELAQNGNKPTSSGTPQQQVAAQPFLKNKPGEIRGAPAADSSTPSAPADQLIPDPSPGLVDARKLIRNANVELEVTSFDSALDKLSTAATQSGGYIATKNSARGGNGKLRGTIIIKVLPQNLDSFLLDLKSLGEVKNQTLAAQDVTKEYTDTAARLRNAQRMEERLLKMLDEAKGKISEILQVEKELGRVRESIEQMTGELKLYDSLVSYATVTLSLYEKDLNQPAAFLLRQSGNLDLLAADVEKTYAEARRIADAVQAQISDANVSRDSNGKVNATLSLLIPAPAADQTLRQLKALGRIANFNSQTARIAQNGTNTDAGSNNAKVENAPASFRLSIQHDEQTHRKITFTVFASDLDQAFDAAKKSATDAGAEIVDSILNHPRDRAGTAQLNIRVPAQKHAELVDTLQKLGRTSDYRVDRDADDTEEAPVLVNLWLTDEEPTVQQSRLSLQTTDIENHLRTFKKESIAAGATVRDSSFQRSPDGRETAQIVLRFPLEKYPDFLARAQALGKTQELSVQRRDKTNGALSENDAPAELTITLATENKIVADNTGLAATLRRTLSQAIASLLWSVQMIGVALAFLAPWAAGFGVAWLIVRRWRQKK